MPLSCGREAVATQSRRRPSAPAPRWVALVYDLNFNSALQLDSWSVLEKSPESPGWRAMWEPQPLRDIPGVCGVAEGHGVGPSLCKHAFSRVVVFHATRIGIERSSGLQVHKVTLAQLVHPWAVDSLGIRNTPRDFNLDNGS